MPTTPLFREEEADILLFVHAVFRRAVAKHHATRLELFFHLHTRNQLNRDLVSQILSDLQILPTIEGAASQAILEHPLLVQMRFHSDKLISKVEKVCAHRLAQSQFTEETSTEKNPTLKTPTEKLDESTFRELINIMKRFDLIVNRFDTGLTASLTDIDELTGLLNRTALERDLKREQAQAKRTGRSLCVAMIDADHFKKVNDDYGHHFGDLVLEALADRFEESLRPRDQVYRYGGEEFLILLPDTTPEQAVKVMERVRRKTSAQTMSNNDVSITQTVSIGVTSIGTEEIPSEAICRADDALYHAKETGRDKVVLWHDGIESQ